MFYCKNCSNLLSITSVVMPDETQEVIFKCINCAQTYPIEPKTKILSLSSKNKIHNKIDINKYKQMVNDPTLPHTANYICINDNCKTHEKPELREAVWFKPIVLSHTIITLCKVCNEAW